MSLELLGFGLVLIGLGLGLTLASGRRRSRRMLDQLEREREIDRAVPVWSRRPLYDWEQGRDFG